MCAILLMAHLKLSGKVTDNPDTLLPLNNRYHLGYGYLEFSNGLMIVNVHVAIKKIPEIKFFGLQLE